MRWLSYILLAYLVLALQMALGGIVNWGSWTPNLVLPLAVFVAVNAQREHALLGVFALGLLQDLLIPQQPLGLYAFCYGLVGLFVVGTQPAVYRDHPLTHFFLTLVAALCTGLIVLFNAWAYRAIHATADLPALTFGRMLGEALYTALLAPFVLFPLVRIKPLFGFRGTRVHPSSFGRRVGRLTGE